MSIYDNMVVDKNMEKIVIATSMAIAISIAPMPLQFL